MTIRNEDGRLRHHAGAPAAQGGRFATATTPAAAVAIATSPCDACDAPATGTFCDACSDLLDAGRMCSRCLEDVDYVSTDGLCDGCVAEDGDQ